MFVRESSCVKVSWSDDSIVTVSYVADGNFPEVHGVRDFVIRDAAPFETGFGRTSPFLFLPSHGSLYDLIHAVNTTLWSLRHTHGHVGHSRTRNTHFAPYFFLCCLSSLWPPTQMPIFCASDGISAHRMKHPKN